MGQIKRQGERGGKLISGAETAKSFYQIHVLELATFTVLNEKDKETDVAEDVMATMNLTGNNIPAGTRITPSKEFFSDVTLTAGKAWGYNIK